MLKLRTNKRQGITRGRDVTFPGSQEKIVASNGDLNASSQKELLKNIAFLLEGAANGTIDLNDTDNTEKNELTAAQKVEMLRAAYDDYANGNVKVWAELGQTLAADIDLTVRREGFMRLILQRNEIVGRVPQVRVKIPNMITAVMMTTPSMVMPQYITGQWITTTEFDLVENVLVNGNDIIVDGEELLQEQYDNGLEAFLTGEDRSWKTMADAVVGTEIPLKVFTGDFTPEDLTGMMSEMITRGFNPRTVIMHQDYWARFLTSEPFNEWFDPITKYSMLQAGRLDTLLGLTFITDGLRDQNLQVLKPGEIYIVAAPEQHGGYTDRGPVMAVPTDAYNNGLDARGWFMKERLSMAIFNPSSIVKGRKA